MAAGMGSMVFDQDLADDGFGNDQVNDIFGDDDDLFNAPAPLPPLSPSRINGANNADETADNKDAKKKKTIKRSPQPRLNEARLTSERGIPALAHLCDGIKFKGKGHEASDLKVLLQHVEHWAHRLYPKYPFEDVIEQAEKLGGKKLVQNSIKQARRGEDDKVKDNDSSDEELLLQKPKESDPTSTPIMTNANFGGQIEALSTPVLGLTPEQLERMRLNRERALAKRKAPQTNQQADESSAKDSQEPKASEETSAKNITDDSEMNRCDLESHMLESTAIGDVIVGERDTMESVTIDKETMETETMVKETMETVTMDKDIMETETMDKDTMDTETMDKDTMDTVTMDKETMDKETMETETTIKKTVDMETETMTGNIATKTTEKETGNIDKETMETPATCNAIRATETMETETTEKEGPEAVTMDTEAEPVKKKTKTVEAGSMDSENHKPISMETKPCDKEINAAEKIDNETLRL